ncbi:MAG: trypsin-like serine protease [Myxococcota bacterium]|jgi:V8-like Glu-specific endopeptidase|nr:trypsin-like serine protease [Myxococcota bacterium]
MDDQAYEPLPWQGIEVDPNAIVGGTETNYESWQAAVGLWYDQGGNAGNVCTATLIDPAVVITAAHCVDLPGQGIDAINYPSKIDIVGGSSILPENRLVYSKASSIVTHPSWRGELVWGATDLAMIKLASPITSLTPYGVRNPEDIVEVGETGKIVGYGMAATNQIGTAGYHRVGDTSVLSLNAGLVELGDPAGTCQGDSGGPFFSKRAGVWVLTGVTSFGMTTTCLANRDSWDVNVIKYWSWIDSTLNAMVGHGLTPVAGEGEGDGEGGTDSEDDPPPPFGVNSENPVDCRCHVVVLPRALSVLEVLIGLWLSSGET